MLNIRAVLLVVNRGKTMKHAMLFVIFTLLAGPVHATDLVLGGWSSHQTDSDEEYNEVHDALGFVLDNGFTAVTFVNSYGDRSNVLAYTHVVKRWTYARLALTLGVVTGYEVSPMPYVLPTFSIGAGRVWVDTGIMPALNGFAITHSLRVSF